MGYLLGVAFVEMELLASHLIELCKELSEDTEEALYKLPGWAFVIFIWWVLSHSSTLGLHRYVEVVLVPFLLTSPLCFSTKGQQNRLCKPVGCLPGMGLCCCPSSVLHATTFWWGCVHSIYIRKWRHLDLGVSFLVYLRMNQSPKWCWKRQVSPPLHPLADIAQPLHLHLMALYQHCTYCWAWLGFLACLNVQMSSISNRNMWGNRINN